MTDGTYNEPGRRMAPARKPKILVGIIANDSARYSLFSSCVTKLDLEGLDAKVDWVIGGDWCSARNQLAQATLDEGYDYLWFMDDDHAFSPGLLKKLVSHNLPLMSPLCLGRVAPFPLVTYAGMLDDGSAYLPIDLGGAPEEGLVELEAGGCAGMLIHRSVIEAVPAPWFEYTHRSEDIVFCEKAKAAGFRLFADLTARLGHITTAVVWPAVNDGQWMTGITVGRDLNLFVSLASEWEEAPVDESEPEHVPDGEEPLPSFADPGPSVFGDTSYDAGEQPQAQSESQPLSGSIATDIERAEIWFDPADTRWHGRTVDHEGTVLRLTQTHTQEQGLLDEIEGSCPGIGVFHITDEFQDSRNVRQFGPPARIWTRQPKETT